jgi:signal transduction histidine kinase
MMMGSLDRSNFIERTIGRRRDDFEVRELITHYQRLFNLGQVITSEINMDTLFEVIIEQTNQIMEVERTTVFLHDSKKNELWSFVATGMKRDEIRISTDFGITGWVFQSKEPLFLNNTYSDPRFYSEIDKISGFKTKKILCVPLINRDKKCIGTLEALNKIKGDFGNHDVELLTAVSYYVTIALENSKMYEELKALDRAKERMINHLSHELRTPLAIISSVLKIIPKKIDETDMLKLGKIVDLGRRNMDRLFELQNKISDILNQRSFEEKERIKTIVEEAASIVEELGEESHGRIAEVLELVSKRIESIFAVEEVRMEKILVDEFLHDVCDEAISIMPRRELKIIRNFEKDVVVNMDRDILKKVCSGLLKNAIENTPDEGEIEITVKSGEDEVQIDFHDYGIGITPENQRMIFGGFIHTQETDFYSSKRPYEFNAGGSGSDLLRIKMFSERYGFSVDFESVRCKFIPEDTSGCPGRISGCQSVHEKSECCSSGGSTFSVRFPITSHSIAIP